MTFRGFKTALNDFGIRYMDHSDQFLPQGINTMSGIKFENSDPAVYLVIDRCGPQCVNTTSSWTMSSRMESLWDFDGTVAGSARPTIFGSNMNWWQADDTTCRLDSRFRVPLYSCDWTVNRQIGYIAPKVVAVGCWFELLLTDNARLLVLWKGATLLWALPRAVARMRDTPLVGCGSGREILVLTCHRGLACPALPIWDGTGVPSAQTCL